jgi:hypothetical protein
MTHSPDSSQEPMDIASRREAAPPNPERCPSHREPILRWSTLRLSHECIARSFQSRALTIFASALGSFCRPALTSADLQRGFLAASPDGLLDAMHCQSRSALLQLVFSQRPRRRQSLGPGVPSRPVMTTEAHCRGSASGPFVRRPRRFRRTSSYSHRVAPTQVTMSSGSSPFPSNAHPISLAGGPQNPIQGPTHDTVSYTIFTHASTLPSHADCYP